MHIHILMTGGFDIEAKAETRIRPKLLRIWSNWQAAGGLNGCVA